MAEFSGFSGATDASWRGRRAILAGQGMVVVKVRGSSAIVLPDADLQIGAVADSDTISMGYEPRAGGRRAFAAITDADRAVRRVVG